MGRGHDNAVLDCVDYTHSRAQTLTICCDLLLRKPILLQLLLLQVQIFAIFFRNSFRYLGGKNYQTEPASTKLLREKVDIVVVERVRTFTGEFL